MNIQLPHAHSDRVRLSDLVYRAILDALFRGELRASEIVSEVLLARSLGVSRTPVHAAVRDLVRDGLLVQDGGKRSTVAQITRDDLREIFEMRRLLEGEAAFRAAESMDRQAMQRLEEECAALGRLTGEAEILVLWSAHDDAFHEAIASSCAHSRLASDILRYRRIHYALNSIRMKAELVPQAAAEHGAILKALARRDPTEARRGMNLHLIEWQAYYTNLFSQRR